MSKMINRLFELMNCLMKVKRNDAEKKGCKFNKKYKITKCKNKNLTSNICSHNKSGQYLIGYKMQLIKKED